ncbi:MAG TPA: class I SAM-dependent methyltransferase [Pseudonocardiaceae bacterium]
MTGDVAVNRAYWDERAEWFAARARVLWSATEPVWGNWNLPQSQLPVLPDDLRGLDTIELGCGTAYISAWLARAGARPVGIDNSARQLATAAAMQEEFGLPFPLVHGDAQEVPYPDASFDLVISEYGASVWCDPYRWVPEAARLLRPGGRLVFLRSSTLLMLCLPEGTPTDVTLTESGTDVTDGGAGRMLRRDLFGMHRTTRVGADGVEYHLPHGEWIRLLSGSGFVLDDLVEVRAPDGAVTDFDYVTADWARRWPSEEVWFAHLPE